MKSIFLSTSGVVGILLAFQLANYGLGLWVLRTSRGIWSDLFWLVAVFPIPFGLLEFLWLQAWRMGLQAQLSIWTMHVLVLSCHIAGSALAVFAYCGELPSARTMLGLAIVCLGAFCCLSGSK